MVFINMHAVASEMRCHNLQINVYCSYKIILLDVLYGGISQEAGR